MKEEMKSVVAKMPVPLLRAVVSLLIVTLATVGGVGATMEWNWRAARVSAEASLDKRQDKQELKMTQLVEATASLTKATENCHEEVKEYREEMRKLRQDQVEWARQFERALRDGRNR